MKCVGIIAKLGKPEAEQATVEINKWLFERGVEVIVDARTARKLAGLRPVEPEEIPRIADMVIVLGGDGTLIHAAGLVGPYEKPILGVNLGGLGFLTEVSKDEVLQVLGRILEGDYRIEERMKLNVKLLRNGKLLRERDVLNDAVVNKAALARMIDLSTHIADGHLSRFKADGIIVSTPTGSTAYSMAAGGPILSPTLNSIVIAPICPHMLTCRPLVVSADSRITVTLGSASGKVYLTLDGQEGEVMEVGDVVQISRSSTVTKLIKSSERDFFEILRTKLHWAER